LARPAMHALHVARHRRNAVGDLKECEESLQWPASLLVVAFQIDNMLI
jgi:hypothetical protein